MQVSGGGNRVVRVWSADTCTHLHTFRGHRGTVTVRKEGRGERGDGEYGSYQVRGGLGSWVISIECSRTVNQC